jgi:hypothetical protein
MSSLARRSLIATAPGARPDTSFAKPATDTRPHVHLECAPRSREASVQAIRPTGGTMMAPQCAPLSRPQSQCSSRKRRGAQISPLGARMRTADWARANVLLTGGLGLTAIGGIHPNGCIHVPDAGNALQLVLAPRFERYSRAGNEIPDGA